MNAHEMSMTATNRIADSGLVIAVLYQRFAGLERGNTRATRSISPGASGVAVKAGTFEVVVKTASGQKKGVGDEVTKVGNAGTSGEKAAQRSRR